jgi:hypothetical protein
MPMSQSEIERELRSLQQKVTVYEELLKETRRSEERAQKSEERAQKSEDRAQESENRLLTTVHWALALAFGILVTAIAAVLSLNWWINDKVYTQDKQVLRNDLINTVKEEVKNLGGGQATSMQEQFTNLKNELLKAQDSSYAQAFLQLADMRQSLLDLEGALMDAIVAFHKAPESIRADWIGALERMDTAIRRATMGQKRLPIMLL